MVEDVVSLRKRLLFRCIPQWIATAFLVWLLGGLGVRGHTARADAPAGRYSTTSTEVTDTKTKLVWKRSEEVGSFTWPAAKAQCASLGGAWRLPTVRELQSIVDETRRPGPTIDLTAFPGATGGPKWTSTAYALSPGYAWNVYFVIGDSGSDLMTQPLGVRCVR